MPKPGKQSTLSLSLLCYSNFTTKHNSSSLQISGSEPAYTIGDDHITAGPSYTAVDCRRPSFSCRRCAHLDRPAAPRHVRIISLYLFSEAVWWCTFSGVLFRNFCHCWHSNRSFCLFTYLLTGTPPLKHTLCIYTWCPIRSAELDMPKK